MKICVSAVSNSLDAQIDPRFGRCPYFVIVNTENMSFEALPNASQEAAHGAGIQAAQKVVGKGVQVVLTGNVGPNAFHALSSAGIKIVTDVFGTVRGAVERYKQGELKETGAPTVGGHFGMGQGRGRRWAR